MHWHELCDVKPDLQGNLEAKARWVATKLWPGEDVIYLVEASPYPSVAIEHSTSDHQYGLGYVHPDRLSFEGSCCLPAGCSWEMTWAEVEQMALDNGLSLR